MKDIIHEDFYHVYNSDSASAASWMEAIVEVIKGDVEFITAVPATETNITMVHDKVHIDTVRYEGLYSIAALAKETNNAKSFCL